MSLKQVLGLILLGGVGYGVYHHLTDDEGKTDDDLGAGSGTEEGDGSDTSGTDDKYDFVDESDGMVQPGDGAVTEAELGLIPITDDMSVQERLDALAHNTAILNELLGE